MLRCTKMKTSMRRWLVCLFSRKLGDSSVSCRYAILRHILPRALSFTVIKMANESVSEEMGKSFPHFGTLAIHAGQEPEQWYSRAVVPPISMATTFKQDAPGVHRVRKLLDDCLLSALINHH